MTNWTVVLAMGLVAFFSTINASASDQTREHTVELQWSLCETSSQSFFQKTKVSSGSENRRQVFYRETKTQDLYGQDSFIRTRFENGDYKRTFKVKYPDEQSIPWATFSDWGVECEKDTYTSQFKWGCSLKTQPETVDAPLTILEEAFLRQEVGFTDIQKLLNWGPVTSSEWKFKVNGVSLSLETLKGPENYFSMELSAKVKLSKETETASEMAKWIQAKRLILCPVQQGKTGELLKILIKTRSVIP